MNACNWFIVHRFRIAILKMPLNNIECTLHKYASFIFIGLHAILWHKYRIAMEMNVVITFSCIFKIGRNFCKLFGFYIVDRHCSYRENNGVWHRWENAFEIDKQIINQFHFAPEFIVAAHSENWNETVSCLRLWSFSLGRCRRGGAPNRKATQPQISIATRTQLNAAHTDTFVEAKRNKWIINVSSISLWRRSFRLMSYFLVQRELHGWIVGRRKKKMSNTLKVIVPNRMWILNSHAGQCRFNHSMRNFHCCADDQTNYSRHFNDWPRIRINQLLFSSARNLLLFITGPLMYKSCCVADVFSWNKSF